MKAECWGCGARWRASEDEPALIGKSGREYCSERCRGADVTDADVDAGLARLPQAERA